MQDEGTEDRPRGIRAGLEVAGETQYSTCGLRAELGPEDRPKAIRAGLEVPGVLQD